MSPVVPSVARRVYTEGATYLLEPVPERSYRSHAHYFACLNDGWLNLPDHLAPHFPSAEHLRKHLLIRTGYHDVRTITCSDKREARRVAAFVKPLDEYAIITTKNKIVNVFTARSQSGRGMTKSEFQKSKDAVLDALAVMIGVDRQTLADQAGQAA